MTDIDVDPILENWGIAFRGGWPKTGYPSQSAEQAMRGGILDGKTVYTPEDVEKAEYIICRMPGRYKFAIKARYVWGWDSDKRILWRWSARTFWRRLDEAKKEFGERWINTLLA